MSIITRIKINPKNILNCVMNIEDSEKENSSSQVPWFDSKYMKAIKEDMQSKLKECAEYLNERQANVIFTGSMPFDFNGTTTEITYELKKKRQLKNITIQPLNDEETWNEARMKDSEQEYHDFGGLFERYFSVNYVLYVNIRKSNMVNNNEIHRETNQADEKKSAYFDEKDSHSDSLQMALKTSLPHINYKKKDKSENADNSEKLKNICNIPKAENEEFICNEEVTSKMPTDSDVCKRNANRKLKRKHSIDENKEVNSEDVKIQKKEDKENQKDYNTQLAKHPSVTGGLFQHENSIMQLQQLDDNITKKTSDLSETKAFSNKEDSELDNCKMSAETNSQVEELLVS